MLGAFASFGGVSYAAERISHNVVALKHAVVSAEQGVRVTDRSPARDQYHTPPPVTPPAGGGVSGAGGGGVQPTVAGNLPFTGFPVFLTGALGLGLILVGLILRRGELRR
jgi:hypothetical protein